MRTRTSPSALLSEAIHAFTEAVTSLGIDASEATSHSGRTRIDVTPPNGKPVTVEISASSMLPSGYPQFRSGQSTEGVINLVVADRVPEHLRVVLNGMGHGWLDRRGHLRLVGPGLFVDADVPPAQRTAVAGPPGAPISGRSGLAAAAALLMQPDDPMGVSEIAHFAGLNASSISRALASIANAQLAERIGRGRYRPLAPELFWALAEVWPRDQTRTGLGIGDLNLPGLATGAESATGQGWAFAGERGAVSWGAPLVLTGDYPAFAYVLDDVVIRTVLALRPAEDSTRGPTVALAVDPTGLIASHRFRPTSQGLPLAHPLFCALDLTATARDREALDQWTPPKEFTRVW